MSEVTWRPPGAVGDTAREWKLQPPPSSAQFGGLPADCPVETRLSLLTAVTSVMSHLCLVFLPPHIRLCFQRNPNYRPFCGVLTSGGCVRPSELSVLLAQSRVATPMADSSPTLQADLWNSSGTAMTQPLHDAPVFHLRLWLTKFISVWLCYMLKTTS